MATNIEIRTTMKMTLHDLLLLKRQIEQKEETGGTAYNGLLTMINKMEAGMESEDVAWVQKKISELKM